MTDYFVSNTFRFFTNGDADIIDLLEMVERYNDPSCVEKQIEIINMIHTLDMSIEIDSYRRIAEQYQAWKSLLTIMNSWDEAWISVVKENPLKIRLCGNPTVINYAKLMS